LSLFTNETLRGGLVLFTGQEAMTERDRERAAELERTLALSVHPEGGSFHEHHREPRDASTAIYFLLRGSEVAAWHRLSKDELWHHYEGDPVELHLIHLEHGLEHGPTRYERVILGPTAADVRPCRVVASGVWQAARLVPGGRGYALVGNTVAPGFSFDDWTLADRELLERFAATLDATLPEARELLFALSRP
jgi:predicted cupin superfamily sugar epimerase